MPNSPSYYTRGNIEVWDFVRDQQLNYHLGNALKYICRAGHKSAATKASDIKKAIHYLENELKNTTSTESIYRNNRSNFGMFMGSRTVRATGLCNGI